MTSHAHASCPACGSTELSPFHSMHGIPALSCTIWDTVEEAKSCPQGDIDLALCRTCGLLINTSFEPKLLHYDEAYVASLHHSPLFGRYATDLATDLIERYDLHEKLVLEIGCGKGEFLKMMVELGNNRGAGFDPSYEEPPGGETDDRLSFVKEFYTEAHLDLAPDLVIARQLLEHVEQPFEFVRSLRRTLGDRSETVVVFEVPNALDMLHRADLWDVIYEHPIYFTPQALERLMRSAGFEVHRVRPAYEGLFLIVEASPGADAPGDLEAVGHQLDAEVAGFAEAYAERRERWKRQLEDIRSNEKRAVLWGAGARGDTFLNAIGIDDEISMVVDLNPRKWGKHMAGTGQQIFSPEDLKARPPDVVVIANEIYLEEIRGSLRDMGIDAEVL
ncbi:MAG: methyltransferase domain-containing protein, partial [Deltaproteobacteria bacterium]|nr:methyltransferase domain-containing protein [Deltaproteobacteria bacterium]